jgi:hypothetical protein
MGRVGRESDEDGLQIKTEISKSKCQMNFKAQNRILKRVQNDTLVMPNLFRHLICDLHLI